MDLAFFLTYLKTLLNFSFSRFVIVESFTNFFCLSHLLFMCCPIKVFNRGFDLMIGLVKRDFLEIYDYRLKRKVLFAFTRRPQAPRPTTLPRGVFLIQVLCLEA